MPPPISQKRSPSLFFRETNKNPLSGNKNPLSKNKIPAPENKVRRGENRIPKNYVKKFF
jgi:hypothetical protein